MWAASRTLRRAFLPPTRAQSVRRLLPVWREDDPRRRAPPHPLSAFEVSDRRHYSRSVSIQRLLSATYCPRSSLLFDAGPRVLQAQLQTFPSSR